MPSRDRILMEYFDDELSSGAADDVRRLLEPGDERVLAEWTAIGDVVRAVTDRDDGVFCDVAGRLMEQIRAEDALGGGHDAHELQLGRFPVARRLPWRRIARAFTPLAAFGAAAAVALTMLSMRTDSAPANRGGAASSDPDAFRVTRSVRPEIPSSASANDDEVSQSGAAIERLDLGAAEGVLFVVATDHDEMSVVWLSEGGAAL